MGALEGKLSLVTGAGTGIGLGVAQKFAEEGASVVFHYASSAKGALDAVADINARGGKALAIQADLRLVSECRRLVEEAVDFLGGLDILVNNAGVTMTKSFEETTEEDYTDLFNVNMRGYYFCAQESLKHILQRDGGSILNMTSVHAFAGFANHTAYAATKGANYTFTRTLATELAPKRVRVNAIGPGLIEVPRYFRTMPDYTTEKGQSWVPWGRVGLPEDIGSVAVFLSSDGADFITGQVIYVDGGQTAKMSIPRD